ncbi:MAG: hypothetical protein HWE27_03070 [Gammaproteobacteria bacterium]|nr:hypothetical protein [Gammaproteobacteria bacterium]
MTEQFEIIEKFEITNRGAVVVIEAITERVPGKPYKVEVTGKDNETLTTEAYKEWLLRHTSEPVEKEAYMLKGLHKKDLAENTSITFV